MTSTEKLGLWLMAFGFVMMLYYGERITDIQAIYQMAKILIGGILFIIGGKNE